MTEEKLIHILESLDKSFIILLDGNPSYIDRGAICSVDEENREFHHWLSSLKIMKNNNTSFTISLDNSWYELEIAKVLNINEL